MTDTTTDKQRRPTGRELRSKRLAELADKATLESFNSFIEAMDNIPSWLAPPILTGRPELLQMPAASSLTQDDVAAMVTIIRVLLRTNAALRDHAAEVGKLAATFTDSLRGAQGLAHELSLYAAFQHANLIPEDDGG
jgi:hypothetical protein